MRSTGIACGVIACADPHSRFEADGNADAVLTCRRARREDRRVREAIVETLDEDSADSLVPDNNKSAGATGGLILSEFHHVGAAGLTDADRPRGRWTETNRLETLGRTGSEDPIRRGRLPQRNRGAEASFRIGQGIACMGSGNVEPGDRCAGAIDYRTGEAGHRACDHVAEVSDSTDSGSRDGFLTP